MPRLLTLNPQALATRRQFEQDIGLSEGKMGMLRDIAETVMPAAGPSGVAASMMEPPRQTTMGEALLPTAIGLAPLMLGRPASAAQRRFKDIAMGVRRHLKGTAVVDEAGKYQRVLHGTPAVFKEFDMSKADPRAKYGPGLYFTEAPEIAGGDMATERRGYAFSRGTGKSALLVPPAEARAAMRAVPGLTSSDIRTLEAVPDVDLPATIANMRQRGFAIPEHISARTDAPNVRPAFLNIKKPFDIDAPPDKSLRQKMRDSGVYVSPELRNNEDLYEDLLEHFGSKEDVTDWLAANGYDGITHIGGSSPDDPWHRVWIAFRPEQVLPAFQEGAPTHFRTRARGER